MKELKVGCARPTGGQVGEKTKEKQSAEQIQTKREVSMPEVRVGRKAPDFEAPAYQDGQFGQVKLSDYLLCPSCSSKQKL